MNENLKAIVQATPSITKVWMVGDDWYFNEQGNADKILTRNEVLGIKEEPVKATRVKTTKNTK